MRYFIALLWIIFFSKKLFFWVYLWQLKEYHIGRFLDHFRTYKGKKLIFNYLAAVKIIFLLGMIFAARQGFAGLKFNLVYLTAVIFGIEAIYALRAFILKKFKRPVLTQKTAVILTSGLSLEALIVFFLFILEFRLTKFTASLLLLDILAPLFFSALVLAFQPLAVYLRNKILKRAVKKRSGFKDLLVVGITGSYGKTSTKELLYQILSQKFRVLKTKEHQNSEVGIAECILDDLNETHQIFICEMGAYNRGGIKLLCKIAQPSIGVITGVNEQHMATFGSQEKIIKAKYELIESLPPQGMAFFNGKNQYCRELYQKTLQQGLGRTYLYGENSELGMENLEGAKAVAKELGMTDQEIENACLKIKDDFPGATVKEGVFKIMDATFSANPHSVVSHLEHIKRFPGKKVIVMPCLIELGRASKEVHRNIGQKIGDVCDLAIITTRDFIKEIKEGVAASWHDGRRVEVIFMQDPGKISEKIKSTCQSGDIILLESRVPGRLISLLEK